MLKKKVLNGMHEIIKKSNTKSLLKYLHVVVILQSVQILL